MKSMKNILRVIGSQTDIVDIVYTLVNDNGWNRYLTFVDNIKQTR